jgi:hypothetical protein
MKESWEVLRDAVEKIGVKMVASELKISQPLLYKWCQPSVTEDNPDASGAMNPLHRIAEILRVTKDIEIVKWQCEKAGGYFVSNPNKYKKNTMHEIDEIHKLVREFSDVLGELSASLSDGIITSKEASRVRKEWDNLKSLGEHLVASMEKK